MFTVRNRRGNQHSPKRGTFLTKKYYLYKKSLKLKNVRTTKWQRFMFMHKMAAVAVFSYQTWQPWSDAANDWQRNARDEELKRGRETRNPTPRCFITFLQLWTLLTKAKPKTQHTFQKHTCFSFCLSFTSSKESFSVEKNYSYTLN